MSVRSFARLLPLAICILLLGVPAFAQSDRGTITGTVLDEAKAVVPGATVTAKHIETGTISKTITTATGNYTLPSLAVGVYEVTIELAGFSKASQPRVQVQLAQTGAMMFLRGDVSAARKTVKRSYSREQVYDSVRLGKSERPYFTPGFPLSIPLQHESRIRSLDGKPTAEFPAVNTESMVSDTGELVWHLSPDREAS